MKPFAKEQKPVGDPESSPFLPERENGYDEVCDRPEFKHDALSAPSMTHRAASFSVYCRYPVVFYVASLLLYTAIFAAVVIPRLRGPQCACHGTWCKLAPGSLVASRHTAANLSSSSAPAQAVLEWEDRHLGAYVHHGSYTGGPSVEVDAAWSDLLQGKISCRLRQHHTNCSICRNDSQDTPRRIGTRWKFIYCSD
jgi:hypothetical protein